MARAGYYEWTVKIRIHPVWVRDGFEVTNERLHNMLQRTLDFAYSHEVEGEVIQAPHPDQIRVEQGHKVADPKRKPRICVNCDQFPCNCDWEDM